MAYKFNPFTGNFDIDTDTNSLGTITSVGGTAPIASSGGTAPVISLNDSGVVAGNYINSNITVSAKGLITSASSGFDLVSYTQYGGL